MREDQKHSPCVCKVVCNMLGKECCWWVWCMIWFYSESIQSLQISVKRTSVQGGHSVMFDLGLVTSQNICPGFDKPISGILLPVSLLKHKEAALVNYRCILGSRHCIQCDFSLGLGYELEKKGKNHDKFTNYKEIPWQMDEIKITKLENTQASPFHTCNRVITLRGLVYISDHFYFKWLYPHKIYDYAFC